MLWSCILLSNPCALITYFSPRGLVGDHSILGLELVHLLMDKNFVYSYNGSNQFNDVAVGLEILDVLQVLHPRVLLIQVEFPNSIVHCLMCILVAL